MKKNKLNNLEWEKRHCYLKNIVFGAEELNQEGTKFQIVRFASGSKLKPHYHKKVTEIFYVVKGEGVFIFNEQRYKVEPGSIFLCEPRDVHGMENDSTEELVFLIFKTNETDGDSVWL